ncbi:VOC family protein [Deinococcus cellulosilyticus]|uniref:Glyoxalase n=1 Tax=Deinococcus cellulosilyticus (strain DSM 18568 / NBRC 106333 / KACC 11606 / 5516J-15) TaxID=1223518 RepID=A0A511N750_DEIC1|nr:VOC family protein [Deinococcus cellulosilyticus]GEM48679.1 glyoxalase [Deinococcus cellulosilyticus NBRC 106333 = KACC 11606]
MPSPIDPKLTLGEVALTVRNLDTQMGFYQQVIGLTLLAREDGKAVLGTQDGHPLVSLFHNPGAKPAPSNATGLYHLAIAFPTRPDLARWLKHVSPLGLRLGQSDHKTHEAFYLNDPEGNGIEIYQDWPAEQWPMKDGMMTAPDTTAIDIPGLLRTLAPGDAGWKGAPTGTRMGHVHLKMNDGARTRQFFEGVLGFFITADLMGAVFAGAGGYHHHIGTNAWHSKGGPAQPEGTLGLRHYTIELSSTQELERVTQQLQDAGVKVVKHEAGLFVKDPAGLPLLIRPQPSTAESALSALNPAFSPVH